MAKFITQKQLDIKDRNKKREKPLSEDKQQTLLCKLLILSEPQPLQNGIFDCRQ